MDEKIELSLLYDFYKELLNPSQQRVIELYVNDDLSLSEAADILSISRQGVRDSLSRAKRKLSSYEKKLGLLRAYNSRIADKNAIREMIRNIRGGGDIEPLLAGIESILEKED